MVKYLPAVQETQVQSLGVEDPLEKGMATQYSCPENPINGVLIKRGACRTTVHAKFGHN